MHHPKRYSNPFSDLLAPDLIPGCTFKTGKELQISYIAPFLFQSSIMILTAYKAWSFSREQRSTLLMTKMLHELSNLPLTQGFSSDFRKSSEIKCYSAFVLVLVFIEVGSIIPATKTAVIGSLYGFLHSNHHAGCPNILSQQSLFTTMSSIMCSRIVIYGFSLSQRTNIITTFEDVIEITFTRSRRLDHEWSVGASEQRESLDREESGYPLPVVTKVPSS